MNEYTPEEEEQGRIAKKILETEGKLSCEGSAMITEKDINPWLDCVGVPEECKRLLEQLLKERDEALKRVGTLLCYIESIGGCKDGHEKPEAPEYWESCGKCDYCVIDEEFERGRP